MKESKDKHFKYVEFTTGEILKLTGVRENEVKIGEKIAHNSLENSKFVILGICEDLGPQANGGNPGSSEAFSAFLSKFLSIQSNEFLLGDDIFLAGFIQQKNGQIREFDSVPNVIDELDDFVEEILSIFLKKGLIPIVIGGGHNNAYPMLRSVSQLLNKSISVVNCDAHADFRKTDYRHSGNPFSFAFEKNIISKYAVLGLHQSYNNQFILNEMKKHSFFVRFYDELLISNRNFNADFNLVIEYFNEDDFGIELDMDSIAYMPSSASSPSGISILEARQFISFFASQKKVSYLHLPEAAPKTEQDRLYAGKSLAYLVSDFIKNFKKD